MNTRSLIVLTALAAATVMAPLASAQTPANIRVMMGNGQLVCAAGCTNAPPPSFPGVMYVIITDANNAPIPNYPVTWTVMSGPALVGGGSTITTNTATDGSATITPFVNVGIFGGGTATLASVINVAAGNLSQNITLTDAIPCTSIFCGSSTGFATDQMFIDFSQVPLSGMSGSAGGTASPFTVRVTSIQGIPVPGISVRLISSGDTGDGSSGPSSMQPSAYCQTQSGTGADPYSVLTDANGSAVCTPQFGPVGGNAQVAVVVGGIPAGIWSDGSALFPGIAAGTLYNPAGIVYTPNNPGTLPLPQGYRITGNINISVKAATIGSITATSGNNQQANPGAALPSPLVATVKDTSGNPIAGQAVTWTVSPTSAATLSNQTTITNASGQVSANLTFTSTASGNVTVTATVGTKSVNFTATAIPPVSISSLTKVGGDNQSTTFSQQFPVALQVQIAVSSGSPANQTVTFTVNGPVTLSSNTATTNASGIAQVTATAGPTAGNATVTATIGTATVVFNLSVVAPVTFTASNFVNGADGQRGSIAACGLASIAGATVAPAVAGTVSAPLVGPLPLTLAGVTIAFNTNDYAPILSVASNLVTFQVPCDVTAGNAVPVTVTASGSTGTVNVPVLAGAPGLFSTVQTDGVSRAVLVRPDGTYVSLSNPARRGEYVTAFVTGLGAVSPAVATNSLPIPGTPSTVNGQVIVGVDNAGTVVQSSVLSPDRSGVYLVTFQIPQGAPQSNNVAFVIAVIPVGASSPAYSLGSQIPVQ